MTNPTLELHKIPGMEDVQVLGTKHAGIAVILNCYVEGSIDYEEMLFLVIGVLSGEWLMAQARYKERTGEPLPFFVGVGLE